MPILFSRAKFAAWIINNPNELHLGDEGEKLVDTNQSGKDGGGKEGEREAKRRGAGRIRLNPAVLQGKF